MTLTDKQLTPWKNAIAEAQNRFVALTDPETWTRESFFATQLILKNEYLMKIANSSPASLRNAVTNVAAIGITLNPATAFAYLVPRDGEACLDISYKGLIKIATDTGAIKWAQAELVYANDHFVYHGPTLPPEHTFDPFSEDRGDFQGAYCSARTADGDTLSEAMSASQIYEIRDKSEMYKKKKCGPWKDFFGEMAKKTVIKRASKTWPKSTGSNKLEQAIELLNDQGEGIKFEKDVTEIHDTYTIAQKEAFERILNGGQDLELYLLQQIIPQSAWIDLYNSGGDRQIGKLKAKVSAMLAKGFEVMEAIREAIDSADEHGLAELIEGCSDDLLKEIPPLLSQQQASEYLSMLEVLNAA